MSCVARPHQTPIGTASNFLQCKWVSCSKSYWQGYDLAWYKDMEAPCFPQPNLWLARCASRSWAALRKFVVLSTQASKQEQQAAASKARSKQAASKQQASSSKQQASQPAASSKQQQAAASSSKQQQQQQASSSRQAAAGKQASKQQPAFAPLKEWTHVNWTFSRSTALKQWTISITKSCDDAKLELFPGARPPDTTFRNWYDLNRALVWSSKNPTEIHGFDPPKASKTIQQITANLVGTATIATTPLKSFAQWYGLKSKESLRLWPLTVTSLMNMSFVLRLPREMHLWRSSSNVPRLPSFLEMLQNPHVLPTFDKVHNPLSLPRKTTSERFKVFRTRKFLHWTQQNW